MAVVVFHLGVGAARGGWLGVSLFFTVSGFIIATTLLDEHDRAGRIALGRFWGRRARRLLPAAWVTVLAVVVPAVVWPSFGNDLGVRGADALAVLAQVANWRFLAAGSSYAAIFEHPSPLLHFWSLAIEEQAYLVVPLLVVVALRAGRGRRVLAVAAVLAAGVSFALPALAHLGIDRTYYGTDTRLGELLVGVAIAAAVGRSRLHALPARWVHACTAVGGVGLVGAMVTVPRGAADLTRGLLPAVAACSVLLVTAAVSPVGALARVGRWRPVAWCGRTSYTIYLVHWPVVVAAGVWGWRDHRVVDLALVPVIGVLAHVLSKVVEGPIRRGRVSWRGLVPMALAGATAIVLSSTVFAPSPPAGADLIDSLDGALGRLVDTTVPISSAGPSPTELPAASDGTPTSTAAVPSTAPGAGPFTVRSFGDSILLSLVLAAPADAAVHFVNIDGDLTLGCGIAAFDEPDETGPITSCPSPAQRWGAAFASNPTDAAVVMSCQWETVDRWLPGASSRTALGDPAFDDHVGDAIEATIDSLLGAGAPMVLWVRCPYFSATVGADLLPPRLVASRDPARVDRLDELIDDAAARHPGQVCVVGFDDWVDRRVDDPAIRPDGSHYEWREPTGAGDAYLASLVAAHDACTDES